MKPRLHEDGSFPALLFELVPNDATELDFEHLASVFQESGWAFLDLLVSLFDVRSLLKL